MSLAHRSHQTGHVDNVSARLTQPWQSKLASREHADDIKFKETAEIVNFKIINRLMRRMPPRVIDQAIEPPMHLDGLINQVFECGEVCNIAWNETYLPFLFFEIAEERLAVPLTAGTEHNLCAGVGKRSNASFTNPLASSGNNYNFVFVSHKWMRATQTRANQFSSPLLRGGFELITDSAYKPRENVDYNVSRNPAAGFDFQCETLLTRFSFKPLMLRRLYDLSPLCV